MRILFVSLFLLIGILLSCSNKEKFPTAEDPNFVQARENGELANQAFNRCLHFVTGWLNYADPKTGLIPRNLTKDKYIWNAQDAAADNYPFMVLTTALTDRKMFEGVMLDMLRTEERLTSRVGRLPDTYSFSKQDFQKEEINMDRIIFGSSEYVKDGLLPLTEWLGPSPWSERMLGIVDDIWAQAPYSTSYGNIPSQSHEVNGEMLQALSRLYWMTAKEQYLTWALRLADYYLFENHPIKNDAKLRLRDHGCEIISGLAEVYATVHYAAPEKEKVYQEPIHLLFDRILEMGRNEHGMLYNWFNPVTGEHDDNICDTWGYNYNGFYTIYLIDNTESYLQAVQYVLSNLNQNYRSYEWEGSSADGYADAIEGAINLFNREPVPSVADWIDSETLVMWDKQQPDGVIEGWHGDGNFARTTIMYALWKTKGLSIKPWREDVKIGAELNNGFLYINITSEQPWQGKILFDIPRHQQYLNLPLDYPRINQFPEWFTVDASGSYFIKMSGYSDVKSFSGQELAGGLAVEFKENQELRILVEP